MKKERIISGDCQPKRIKFKERKDRTEGPDERTKIMRSNVIQVLNNSTVMPFRWLKSSYRCFYCYEVFQEPKDLKTHQDVHINDETKHKCMENYWEPTVHVDISGMSCKLCPKMITEFYDLIDHLMSAHDVPFNKDIGICMNPFKLNNISVQCALCTKDYRTFGHLLLHMNEEHKGYSQLLCDVCGRHCRNKNHLRDHKKEHINRSVTCTICGETLSSYHKLRPHMQNVHDKKYKCLACPEQFETHYKRSLHMMTVHKSREEVKCQYCPKTFVFRSTMMAHLRVTHLQEKNTICGICGWRTVGKSKLKRHMSKHSNEKNYKCAVCEKAFKTKKNMLLHQRNVHEKELQMPHAFPSALQ